jgi:hypothetical protein
MRTAPLIIMMIMKRWDDKDDDAMRRVKKMISERPAHHLWQVARNGIMIIL